MSNEFETPILFLIFNRPDTTQQVFNQLKQLKPKYLFVAADGPRLNKPGEFEICLETRNIINQIDWDCKVKTLFRDENSGCGIAVSSAISWFFEQVEYGIILEDDCLPDLSFFPYCEELLIRFKDNQKIMMIGGNNFQNGIQRGDGSYYFSNFGNIWGWASWRRAWQHYKREIRVDKLFFSSLNKGIINNWKERKYWNNKLLKVVNGRIDTWDYQWIHAIWKNNGYSITPNCNLVVNLGFRNASTHTFLHDSFKEIENFQKIELPLIHPEIKVDQAADRQTFKNVFGYNFKRLFRLYRENNLFDLIQHILKKLTSNL